MDIFRKPKISFILKIKNPCICSHLQTSVPHPTPRITSSLNVLQMFFKLAVISRVFPSLSCAFATIIMFLVIVTIILRLPLMRKITTTGLVLLSQLFLNLSAPLSWPTRADSLRNSLLYTKNMFCYFENDHLDHLVGG